MKERPLRYGFTTGTCAAAAAKAAAAMLLWKESPQETEIMTPKGITAKLPICCSEQTEHTVTCAVQKDAGDDPDVTHGSLIYAKVSYIEDVKIVELKKDWYSSEQYPGLYLTGGSGVGRVTRPGLSCPVGMPAINPVPRQMIFDAVGAVIEAGEWDCPLLITISIPDGVALAEKTFNPNLGIEGGISVLGTSGIVEPMSEQALLDTICLEIHMKVVEGDNCLILAPGNYGMDFLKNRCSFPPERVVKCSNFIADAVERAALEGFRQIYLAGHIGKLIKVAGGARNTHSKYGDGRMESLKDCTKACLKAEGAKNDELLAQVLASNTTEEALGYLDQAGMLKAVMDESAGRVKRQLLAWCAGPVQIEVVTFSTVYDILGMTSPQAVPCEVKCRHEGSGDREDT